ncbi:uncharacterized zinc finger CCHC domain-containing protein At4g19190 [Punica granatum]|uniref:Uncharacterized zinc finger CCHC domain-containing protein At4g19190 n=1 Tax=Punica granatum TaxID=22663 RepID=A0A6P8DEL7_PUNGR|nr:uncharacterized zinc finger CCHC domain-containing protein At4g19190 [Punica granatum]
MDGEEGEGLRLSKRFSDKNGSGEVDYKTKSGTAWSHSYLNQKPWHPLSYPNQRRKWIAEQLHAQRDRRAEEIAREYAQEQEFFRQSALVSKKEKEKVEMMKAVSFMYVRPPGYNPESARAAEIADERKKQEQGNPSQNEPSSSKAPESITANQPAEVKKKPRPKDVFGRPLPTEEEFEILKNAPRLDTGIAARAKPFGVEVRNVKCVRCGNYGHQSGDRECPLKDVIMPNEESRIKRDDPLNAILAQQDPSEPLKWELKQRPGMSPPRGGFDPDDPNQQIVAEDIFDEYGGFLGGESINIPDLLTNFSASKPKKRKSSKKSKHRETSPPSENERRKSDKQDKKHHKKRWSDSESASSEDSVPKARHREKSRGRRSHSSEDSDPGRHHGAQRKRKTNANSSSSEDEDESNNRSKKSKKMHYFSESSEDGTDRHDRTRRNRKTDAYLEKEYDSYERHSRSKKNKKRHSYSSSSEDDIDRQHIHGHRRSSSKERRLHRKSENFDSDDHRRRKSHRRHHH